MPALPPSPADFYGAFLQVVRQQEPNLLETWEKTPQYTAAMFSCFPAIAELLGFCCYIRDYFGLDTIFYQEKDISHFPEHWNYAKFISVALEHENESTGTAEEMNKLQLFNAPLKVLITYPSKTNSEFLLKTYSEIISAADVFEDVSSIRRQLVIFGVREDQKIKWTGFEYVNGSFQNIDRPTALAQTAP